MILISYTEAILNLPLGKEPAIFHIERGVLDVFPRPDKITIVVVKRFFNIYSRISVLLIV
jgi:hypothetical protein